MKKTHPYRLLALFYAALLACQGLSEAGAQERSGGAVRALSSRLLNRGSVVIEAESLAKSAQASAGQPGPQNMRPFGEGWGGDAQLFWRPEGPPAELTLRFNAPAGEFTGVLYYTQGPDYGNAAVFVDGQRAALIRGYSRRVALSRVALEGVVLKAGSHDIRFEMLDKDDASTNYFLGIDKLQLRRQAGQARPGPEEASTARKRPAMEPAQRLRISLDRTGEKNPLLPVLMHTLERGLQGQNRTGASALDRLFDRTLQRHPGVPKEILQKMVADWKSLPETTRARIASPALADLSANTPLDPGAVRSAVANMSGSASATAVIDVSPQVIANLLKALTTPFIAHIDPAAPKGYDPGQAITLVGKNFSANKADNKIVILKEMSGGAQGEVATVSPSVAAGTALEMKLPSGMTSGHYFLRLAVKSGESTLASNTVDLYIRTPPPPAPTILNISPNPQYPGRKVVIEAQGFKTSAPIAGVWFKPMENQPLASFVNLKGEKAAFSIGKVLNSTQVEATVPPTLLAGKYRVAMEIPGSGMSQWVVFSVEAFSYRVNFIKIHCKDESDPEDMDPFGDAPHDEIVAAWAIVADENAWAKSSKEYTNFDDGETKSFNSTDRAVFQPGGTAGKVGQALVISTTLYEWDAGDAESANKVIGFIGDLAAQILTSTGNVEWAAVVKFVTPLIQKVVTWLGGNPDHLGQKTLAWSALELLEETDNQKGMFTGTLDFNNSDSDGSYRLTYEVYRIAP
ncbi:MAG: IPT/TIG domain-containing protein [Armatimonadetes bacterium]|nr:IPT/TIG domain-containing protein [Armatimonadota bacterium]